MKDLTFQIKGLMAKANSFEYPNDVGKRVPAQSKVGGVKKGSTKSNYLPVIAGSKTPSFNPGNVTPEQAGVDEGQLVVGSGVSLKGNIECCKTLKIHGDVEAEIRCDHLVIDEGGTLKGSVVARTAEISGALSGTASVGEKVMIRSTGSFSGNLTYGAIGIELGGLAKGEFDEVTPDYEVQVAPKAQTSKPRSAQLQEKILETETMDREISALRTGGHP